MPSVSARAKSPLTAGRRWAQCGVSLLELMVGLTIGLLVSVAAAGSLAYLQATGRTLTEATRMQQEASLAFDTVGRFVRPAGSVGLQAASGDTVTYASSSVSDSVYVRSSDTQSFEVVLPGGPDGVSSDCSGQSLPSNNTLLSRFEWREKQQQLLCLSNGAEQVLTDGVAQWVVHYGVRDSDGRTQYRPYNKDLPWSKVFGLRLCMVLVSRVPVPEFAEVFRSTPGLTLPDCLGANMANAVQSDQRMRRVYAHVFALRPNQP